MEFCSECGTIMMPKEGDDGIFLVCSNCGNSVKLEREDDYKIGSQKEKDRKTGVAIIEESKARKYSEPDYDIDMDAYVEIYDEY